MRIKQKKNYPYKTYGIVILLLSLLFSFYSQAYSQYKINYDDNNPTILTLGPERNNGFRVSLSLVAMFTSGASDRDGFRFGGGLSLSQTIDNWRFDIGIDAYKAKQKFGLGTSYAGVTFDSNKYGASYYVNKYYQGDKQLSGLVNIHLDDFNINFEDDILAYPFTGFKVYDRYRTAALEIRYKRFMIGTNVYTTDINGVTDVYNGNNKGVYKTGKQISSPLYAGYTTNGLIFRYGVNNRVGGKVGQNSWHERFFNTPNFKTGDYNSQFLQIGIDKPYTLY
ncbi:MAG: polymorphic toxin type 23 domain-containing protein [Dysgonomonas sp.]|nr:polymorphic toxin type 23 domain-containing protein [Dysgonomonas sp.]